MKMINIIMKNSPHPPRKSSFMTMSVTTSPPPRPRKTPVKTEAQKRMVMTMQLVLAADQMQLAKSFHVNRR